MLVLVRLGVGGFGPARLRSVACGATHLGCAEPVHNPQGRPAITRQPGVDVPWALIAAGAAAFALFWWDVPRRVWHRFHPPPRNAREQRLAEERLRARLALAEPPDPAKDAVPVIAGITPGIAAKGMRVAVRDCEITLRAGADGAVVLARTLVRTGAREFTAASRTVRRSLQDPEFVSALIEETGRAVAFIDGNPQLAGAAVRRAELRSLLAALEGTGDGPPR